MTHALTPRRERWLLLTLAGIQFTHILDFMIMMPLGPQFTRIFGISNAQFGLLVSAYTLSAGLSGLLASTAIDLPPQAVKEWATSTFGTASKSVVVGVVVVAVIAIAAWAGVASRMRPRFGIQVMLLAGVVGAVAALLRPVDAFLAPLPSLVAGAAAALALWWLLRMASASSDS